MRQVTTSSTEVKKDGSYTSPPLLCLRDVSSDNFILSVLPKGTVARNPLNISIWPGMSRDTTSLPFGMLTIT